MLFSALALANFTCALLGAEVPPRSPVAEAQSELGSALFADTALSGDGKVSCQSCHDPAHAYSDGRKTSIGVAGKSSTRNTPSLVGVARNHTYFWDGRRDRLEEAVLDPLTNPVELGLQSVGEAIERIRREPERVRQFRAAFPESEATPSAAQMGIALASFVRSLDRADGRSAKPPTENGTVTLGRQLFDGVAGCSECHASTDDGPTLTDERYHHSGVAEALLTPATILVLQSVEQRGSNPTLIGPLVLSDPIWSNLGRFVVTGRPADIGLFRTPSLQNVSRTAPYMHDGSIGTLAQAVDHELFYRGFSRAKPINLSVAERDAIVAYLSSL